MKIAMYIGDALYPGPNTNSTIKILHHSPLTSPILSLVNGYKGLLVYNDPDHPLFNEAGDYVGDSSFKRYISQLKEGANIQDISLSFSTTGTDLMAQIIQNNPAAGSKIIHYIKHELGIDILDLDYEGQVNTASAIYPVAAAAASHDMKVSAAPYNQQTGWQEWVKWARNTNVEIARLNLQCYAGGKKNSPQNWVNMGVPIMPGVCNNCCCKPTTCSPQEIEDLYTLWRLGKGTAPFISCWNGTPNTSPLPLDGGFFWVYSSIAGDKFLPYMNAMAAGLGMPTVGTPVKK